MTTGGYKRLRVRLKAADREGIALGMGSSLRSDGLFLPSKALLHAGTRVLVELCFSDGTVALSGRGKVLHAEPSAPARGMDIDLEWSADSVPRLHWILDRAGQPAPTSPAPTTAEASAGWADRLGLPEGTGEHDVPPIPHAGLHALPPATLHQVPVPELAPLGAHDDALATGPLPRFASEPSGAYDMVRPRVAGWSSVELPAPAPGSVTPLQGSPQIAQDPSGMRPAPPGLTPSADEWGGDRANETSDLTGIVPDVPPGAEGPAEGTEVERHPFGEPSWTPTGDVQPPRPVELAFEPPVEVDGTPSEDLIFEGTAATRGDMIDDPGPPEDDEPILLLDVVEEPPRGTEYAFSTSARDELGPAPAPVDALEAPPAPFEVRVGPDEQTRRETGEVTPLARIELVRTSSSVQAGMLAPPPLEAAQRVAPTAIPSKRHRPSLPPPSRRAMGIDPGNQTTRVAVVEAGHAKVIPSRRSAPGIPSAVFIEPTGKTIVGEPAARRLPWQPELGIEGTARLLGRLFCSPRVDSVKARLPWSFGAAEEDEVALSIGEHFISLEEIEALLLKEAKACVELALSDQVNRVVLTCPVSYGVRQRRALRVAAELAGLHVERVLSAPLAVLLGELKEGRLGLGTYLVYGFGASAFDAAVIRVQSHSAQVLAARGDPELGGAELDQALSEYVLEEVDKTRGDGASVVRPLDVVAACELGKHSLAKAQTTRIHVEHAETPQGPGFVVEVEVDREAADGRFSPLVHRTFEIVQDVLRQADLGVDDLDGVFLVGGQSRLPQVQRLARDRFGTRLVDIEPVEAAVRGAAWAAADHDSTAPYNLHDILTESLAIAGRNGTTNTVIPRGVLIPASGTIEYVAEGPEDLTVFVFEGDRGHVERDEPVAQLRLPKPPADAEWPWTVDLEIEVDLSGSFACFARLTEAAERVRLDEVPECTRDRLRRHFGRAPTLASPTPPTGFFDLVVRALGRSDSALGHDGEE